MMAREYPVLYTTDEVSRLTGQAPRTIQIHAQRYGLGRLYGRVRLFLPEDVEELMRRRRED